MSDTPSMSAALPTATRVCRIMHPLHSVTCAVGEFVGEWLDDTYTPEGVEIWLDAYRNADRVTRDRMERQPHSDGMGT